MRRLIGLAMFIFVGMLFALTACSTGRLGGSVEGESFITEGWVDDDTYHVTAVGVPKATLTNKVARRAASQRAAILNAQYKVLEKFKGATTEGASGMSDFEMTGIAVAQELNGVVKNGSVKKATYDDEDNCEIIYEVRSKGLRNKTATATWQ